MFNPSSEDYHLQFEGILRRPGGKTTGEPRRVSQRVTSDTRTLTRCGSPVGRIIATIHQMYIYPLLALFWSALGVAILVWHWLDPHARFFENFSSAVVAGWVAIGLGVYDLVRWWSTRSARKSSKEEIDRLRKRDKGTDAVKPQPPNPEFDFDKRQDKD
jgi:hypothetical protein